MKLIFAGTPVFAAVSLSALIQAGHEISLVLTQPDRPAGRGMKLKPSAVKLLALEHNLAMAQPDNLTASDLQSMLKKNNAEAMIVVAYGLILPDEVLAIPRYGCINIHASLLPRWRGAAPIQRAIAAGDKNTGISIMKMDSGLDTGDILGVYEIPINETTTAAELTTSLANLGAFAIVKTLANIHKIAPIKQTANGACYAAKISKTEALINWKKDAQSIARHINAFNPTPGASSFFRGKVLKIWRAKSSKQTGEAGQIIAIENDGIVIATGDGAIIASELQFAGSKRLMAQDFVRGHQLQIGEHLTEEN